MVNLDVSERENKTDENKRSLSDDRHCCRWAWFKTDDFLHGRLRAIPGLCYVSYFWRFKPGTKIFVKPVYVDPVLKTWPVYVNPRQSKSYVTALVGIPR